VAWEVDSQGVIVRVTDGGGGDRPHVRHASPRDTSGRGLALVEAVAARWGVIAGATSTTVWAAVHA
jgi:hypothetical protein